MGEFAPLIQKLSDDRLDGLVADDMGVLSLDEVVGLLRLVRRELEAGESLSADEIPTAVSSQLIGGPFGNEIDALIGGMEQYGEATDSPAAQRLQFKASAEGLRNQVIERLRPILRTDEVKAQKTLAAAEDWIARLAQTHADLENQRAALAATAGAAAASDLSTHYKAQAEGHATAATRFLYASGVAGLLLTVLTVLALFVFPPDYAATGTSEQWIEVVRGTVARLAALSIVAFALAFCVRNYRVNMHLEVLNKRRENALNTFGLMQAAVTTDDARNIVVSELVRSVFTSEETGYLGTDTERTVIESPGGAGMLAAMTRGAAPS